MKTANILIFRGVNNLFTYLLPKDEENGFGAGDQVTIPFGKGIVKGIIISIENKKNVDLIKLKTIISLDPKKPRIDQELLHLIIWFKNYYNTTPYKAYQTVIGNKKNRDISDNEVSEQNLAPFKFQLTKEQKDVIQTIRSHKMEFAEFLLFGVTASGKTEIYIRIAQDMLQKNKRVVILIPEIALTPQYSQIFKQRFGAGIAVIHSGLTAKEREIEWNKINQELVDIVIGPRSAIFVPIKNLGLVIIDEEHEASYKQDNHPRYHTHTVARFRCLQNNAFLIYGSATPSIETYFTCFSDQTSSKKSNLLVLSKRIFNQPLPQVEVVDMKQQFIYQNKGIISTQLENSIKENIEKKEKTMILLNRRGYASSIICQKCGEIYTCPQCNLSYTYHHDKSFRCHRCFIKIPLTHTCPKCLSNSLGFIGMGTQKIETELIRLFPKATVYRLDKDTAKNHNQTESILNSFKKDGDILIGTQLIAKGHHIDEVTLVGVLGIDKVLNIPDFRSPERVFQLLTQVAGRAGRGSKKGRVFIQTYHPGHYAITHAITHNFKAFYQEEIDYRKELQYPPFAGLINIIMSAKNESDLIKQSAILYREINENLKPFLNEIQITEPGPAPFAKIQNYFRRHILLKIPHNLYEQAKEKLKIIKTASLNIRVIFDWEPKAIL